jgi:4-amino-4-deoxy-L-arabinose transferase-like glycosyltransferase
MCVADSGNPHSGPMGRSARLDVSPALRHATQVDHARDARRDRWIAVTSAVVALAAFLALRLTGPGDLWDQTQPRTIAYTSDIVARGGEAWALARDSDGVPATKPPLFNWLAVPGVATFGPHLEWAHKLPSLLALVVTTAITVRLGERVRPSLGWFAATILIACPGTWKLAYLARPDMVLTACLTVAWAAASLALAAPRDGPERCRPGLAVAFWASAVLAAWTKGPPAIFAPVFAVLASLVVHRSLEPLRRLGFAIGSLAFLLLAPLWIAAVWRIDPEHAFRTLWLDEIALRAIGEGEGHEPVVLPGIVETAIDSPFYFVTRFAPWSALAILGLLAMLDRRDDRDRSGADRMARWRRVDGGTVVFLAATFACLIVVAFAMSRGKRADYLLPAYPPAAIVAAWWALSDRFSPFRRAPWAIGVVALAVTLVNDAFDRRGRDLPREATDAFDALVAKAGASRSERPDLPVVTIAQCMPHLVAMSASMSPHESNPQTMERLLAEGQPFRVLSGQDPFGSDSEIRVDGLIADGRARELWSFELPKIAVRRRYPVRVRLVEVEALPAQAAER